MSRVALTEAVLQGTNPVSFAKNVNVYIYLRGTTTQAAIYGSEGGAEVLAQPLVTNKSGQPVKGTSTAWLEPASYDLSIKGKTIPWEATKAGGEGGISEATAQALMAGVSGTKYGVVVNGEVDDTNALQNAMNGAQARKESLYIPPGKHKTTATLKWESGDVALYGAGGGVSKIYPTASNFTALEVGPGEGGSGSAVRGYVKDIGFEGGNNAEVERAKTGIASTTGTAAFKLNGERMCQLHGLQVYNNFDIAFDMWHNCYGAAPTNCRAEFNSCRVGWYVRKGSPESGSDSNWYNCWLAGEVCAVMIAGEGGGYHFNGGQLSSSNQSTQTEDGRGVVILGRDYLTGTTGGSYNIDFKGVDWEGMQKTWLIRQYAQCSTALQNCGINFNGASPSIGLIKATTALQSKWSWEQCRYGGTVTQAAENLAVIEGGGSARSWYESNCSGSITANSVSTNMDGEIVGRLCKLGNAHGVNADRWLHNGILFRNNAGAYEKSTDWGTTWGLV